MTGQYMESRKEANLDLIIIYNTTHTKDIVSVHESMFPGTIISIHEGDSKSKISREYKRSDLYVTERPTDELIVSLGGQNNDEDGYLNFDNGYQRK